MKSLASKISIVNVDDNEAAIWWLGQAGFVFKTSNDKIFYLDPYLSNVVDKMFGFKRLSLAPLHVEEVMADWIISSHEHLDHMDIESLPIIAQRCPNCQFVGNIDCIQEYLKMGFSNDRIHLMEPNSRYAFDGIEVHTVRSDHGDLSPNALSLLLDLRGIKVLFTGDTALNIPLMQPLIDHNPDILLTCINGRFGNLNGEEAAQLTKIVKPRAVIPCHFWMFKEHNGDPEAFMQACKNICPEIEIRLLGPSEGIMVKKDTIGPITIGV